MKRVIVLAASVGVLTAACGSSKPASTKPASTPTVTVTATSSTDTLTQTATVPDTSTPEIPSTPGRPQGIGTDIRVTGNVIVGQPADAELIVSAIKVIPIPDSDYVGLLPPQQAAAGVLLKIKNTGDQPFTDDLGGDVQLLAAGGQTGSPDLLPPSKGPCAQNVNSSNLNLQPGQTIHVCVPVTPPVAADVARVRFTPDQGESMDNAEWKLH
jgi:hypothetical protein